MVAIHSPSAEREWFPGAPSGPARAPHRPAPPRRDGGVEVDRLRLPDRATRVQRRRLALLVLSLAVALGVWSAARAFGSLTEASPSSAPEPVEVSPVPVAGQRYVVQPGDTLWSIAAELAPGDDLRPVVDALRAANGDAVLEVGDVLTLDVE